MRYFLVIIVLLTAGAGYYWWTSATTTTNEDETDIVSATTTTQTQNPNPKTVTKLDHQIYTNDTWGITFNYPNDWEIREPAFFSKVSKLNLSVDPEIGRKYPETILINITPKEWIENAIDKMKKDGIVFTDDKVADLDALRFESAYEGMPQIDYLILINNTYWIDISGKKGYETELNQVLDSLTITPVEIPSTVE
ncbi:MAG: hypothetical protein H6779_02305 [Candidatus Nomurabacteria bacterium]|nr:hypothetical protein [Candidatus Nomurabacteria bacterium]USN88255.1 MAG: hypothetical protein H6779_02305 [Candidatus Nomurabacteria bacterium]